VAQPAAFALANRFFSLSGRLAKQPAAPLIVSQPLWLPPGSTPRYDAISTVQPCMHVTPHHENRAAVPLVAEMGSCEVAGPPGGGGPRAAPAAAARECVGLHRGIWRAAPRRARLRLKISQPNHGTRG
jgi:hypothetical protein